MLTAKSKLLIVDDEPATRLLLSQMFTAMGHEVACAADGFTALEKMREEIPDIILSDLNMPGMSGYEFLSVVRRRLPAIYVIATSGAYQGDAIPEGIAADAFYAKATGMRPLLQLVQTASEKPIRERSTAPPIWIAIDRRVTRDGLRLAISCPECLRIFAHAQVDGSGVIQTETCVYCRSAIQYAIVNVLGTVSEREYQTELIREMARQECGRFLGEFTG